MWPEIDTYIKLDDKIRLYFLATTVQENRESTEGEFGVNVDVQLKPLRRRTPLLEFRLDESKNRLLMTRIGYRYSPLARAAPLSSAACWRARPGSADWFPR